jgi:CheY-like chemotaxis protein
MKNQLPKKKLLVLDDEPDLREVYRSILLPAPAAAGITSSRRLSVPTTNRRELEALDVTFASTGEEALQAVSHAMSVYEPFIGGFFDVRLGPGLDGIETIRRLKEMDPNMQCVVVTAYQDRSIDEISKIFGVEFSDRWDYLNKPFTTAEITQKAVHIVAGWMKREQEKRLLKQLDLRQHREELIRELVEDILEKIRNSTKNPLKDGSPNHMKTALETISALTNEAEVLLNEILKRVRAEIDEAA